MAEAVRRANMANAVVVCSWPVRQRVLRVSSGAADEVSITGLRSGPGVVRFHKRLLRLDTEVDSVGIDPVARLAKDRVFPLARR